MNAPQPPVIKAVVFDFFGVICPDLASLTGAEFSQRHGIDPGEFSSFTHDFRMLLDHGGMSQLELAQAIINQFKLSVDPSALCHELDRLDGKYYAFDHKIYSIIRDIKRQATVTLMSNVSIDEADYLRTLGAYKPFEQVFLSGYSHRTKADPVWFDQVAAELGCELREVLLVDDSPRNIATAKSAGWTSSIHYTNPVTLASQLRELGFILT